MGMVMLVRLVQPIKAYPSILVTLLGIVMLVRLVQLSKAAPSMVVTPLGMVNVLPVFFAGYFLITVLFLLNNIPSDELKFALPESTFIVVRLRHSRKAALSILVTLSGIVMLEMAVPAKALPPMLLTLFGMVTLVMPVSTKAPSPIPVTPFGMITPTPFLPIYFVNVFPDILKSLAGFAVVGVVVAAAVVATD